MQPPKTAASSYHSVRKTPAATTTTTDGAVRTAFEKLGRNSFFVWRRRRASRLGGKRQRKWERRTGTDVVFESSAAMTDTRVLHLNFLLKFQKTNQVSSRCHWVFRWLLFLATILRLINADMRTRCKTSTLAAITLS